MIKELPKNYDPSSFEKRLYSYWTDKGCFHAPTDTDKEKYSIVIPPPNITGQLHMGHALMVTVQDIIIRHKRMQGYSAMWLPGTDHASIATEARIVDTMRSEGVTKEDLGREGFLERAWDWRNTYGNRINLQLRELGASLDWERERFTLDEGCNKAVNEVFCTLYEQGLIYRAKRLVNWCPVCGTAISDAEVDHDDKDGNFYHINYPLSDGSGHVEIATTRPETLLGDTAVAVNPTDERYAKLIGKTLTLPLVGRLIPIIADEYVDSEFGTGAVKITPAHDPNDYEVGKRHNLAQEVMLDSEAKITANYEKYAGMDRYDARKAIVADLKADGLLVQVKPHKHNVGACSRCTTVIEPMLSMEWFVKMAPLAEPAIAAVKDQKTRFVPQRFEKTYMHWMENIKDWCISRRLWWGHRIPAYHCACGEIAVSRTPITACPKCGGKVTQDENTLDTWFSSALWPFSTLGWPEKTPDLAKFFPTNTLVTGYDIIFFWVARMIFSSLHFMDEVPFDRVLITGIVRDEQGRKMSKSLNNGIDPLKIIEEYGADALRMSLILGTTPGTDMRVSYDKIKYCRNFANKVWNASRYLMMCIGDEDVTAQLPDLSALTDTDLWALHRYNDTVKAVEEHFEKLDVALAAAKIEEFLWDVFCDFTIEFSKIILKNADAEQARSQKQLLLYLLTQTLKMLHPFMPYVTEEIYQNLPGSEDSIMLQQFPQAVALPDGDVHGVEVAIQLIKAVRNLRSERNIPQKLCVEAVLETQVDLAGCTDIIKSLCNMSFIEEAQGETVTLVVTDAALHLPLSGFVDTAAEKKRLSAAIETAQKEIGFLSGKLSNESFVQKAPAHLVEQQREKLAQAEQKLVNLQESLAKL